MLMLLNSFIISAKFLDLEDLISFLEKTDFFTAPASTRFHGSFEGGLVEHSLKVYEILKASVASSRMNEVKLLILKKLS